MEHQAAGRYVSGPESSLYRHICFPCLETGPRREVSSALYRWQLPKPSPYFHLLLLVYASWVSKGLRIFCRSESKTEDSTFLDSQNSWWLRALARGRSQVGSHPCLTSLLCIPFSPASANICNVVLMRYGELEEGIDVLDADGNLVGSSKIAARHVGFPGAKPCTNGLMLLYIACVLLEVFLA